MAQEADDEDAEEAQAASAEAALERAAALGRASPTASLALLAGLISERRAALLQYASSGMQSKSNDNAKTFISGSSTAIFLCTCGSACHGAMRQAGPPCAGGDPSVALEQLWWLARMAGALLADAGDGEVNDCEACYHGWCRLSKLSAVMPMPASTRCFAHHVTVARLQTPNLP